MSPRIVLSDLSPERFSAGWRLLPVPGTAFTRRPRLQLGLDDIVFDVVRPRDLVALSVTLSGCVVLGADSDDGGEGLAVIRRLDTLDANTKALLAVEFAPQHGHEFAAFEADDTAANTPNPASPMGPPLPTRPAHADAELPVVVPYYPARATRLVFEVPAGRDIAFTSEGVLAAIGSLNLVLHEFAGKPGDGPEPHIPGRPGNNGGPGRLGRQGQVIGIGSGVVARFTETGPIIDVLRPADRGAMINVTPGETEAPTAVELVFGLRKLRSVRAALDSALSVVNDGVPRGLVVDGLAHRIPGARDPLRTRGTFSRRPTPGETAIEAPFRLVLTPPEGARWAHAESPVASGEDDQHVELWHTRLASTLTSDPDDPLGGPTTESQPERHTVRAIWARDRDTLTDADWQAANADLSGALSSVEDPFRGSLNGADRHRLVRQTSERWPAGIRSRTTPHPVTAHKLWLSSLGAWLDLHGAWDTKEYSAATMGSVLAWDHIAPMGRDQFVRTVYPGYLYGLGHQAVLVKITERKMTTARSSVAGLYQRKFLVVTEPIKYFTRPDFPFISIELRPTVTPNLDDPGNRQNNYFWPTVGGSKFAFALHARDQENRPVMLSAPLIWVAESLPPFSPSNFDRAHLDAEYDASAERVLAADVQEIAFTPARPGGDSVVETEVIRLRAKAGFGTAVPWLSTADIRIPSVQRLSPLDKPITITYFDKYRAGGFAGAGTGEIWATVRDAATAAANTDPALAPSDPVMPATPLLAFGQSGAGSDKSGGFVAPSQPIRGLSTLAGPVGDVTNMAAQRFDPREFLKGAAPKLFGIVNLVELIGDVAPGLLDEMPTVASETLGRIEQLLHDIDRARTMAADAADEGQRMLQKAQGAPADVLAVAQQAQTAASEALTAITDVADTVPPLLAGMVGFDLPAIETAFAAARTAILGAATKFEVAAPLLTPLVRAQLATMARVLGQIADLADLAQDIRDMLDLLDPRVLQVSFRYEWVPPLKSWPSAVPGKELLKLSPHGLRIAINGRASGSGALEVQALAELRDFELKLFPAKPLVRIRFDHMSFTSGSAGKAEVDVVLDDIEFVGMLSFIEVIKDLIPFDGFSDPPYLDVKPEGLTAGFTLALPSVAIGVFALANMSLAADVHVPFLGKSVSVGFSFCARERPFTLAVVFLGGGGWFGLRLSPQGLDQLELGLEAGACLSVDFGVASGSISAMIGIYIRLEGEDGSLTGYFRLRGEVDVLGLISASIELYLELVYAPRTGKMTGRAIITVEVKVLFFSCSVQIEAEREFAGSNGDPTFLEVMCHPDGTSPDWDAYCLAFVPEGA